MRIAGILGVAIGGFSLFFSQPVRAEMLTLGRAVGGQIVKLDTASIPRSMESRSWWVGFVYYLGNKRIEAGAHCGRGIWSTTDSKEHKPQSQATRNMINIVCSARYAEPMEDMGYVLVFDPPSNVRSSPGGPVKCTLDSMIVVSVYVEPNNGWYSTDACGGSSNGWIHSSQFRAFD